MQNFALAFFCGTREQGNGDAHFVGIHLEVGIMLLREDLGWGDQSGLRTAAHSNQNHNEGHNGFTTAHITLQQAVHLFS